MTKAKTGRPALSTDAQVLAAVASIEAIGGSPTADAVKRVLIDEHGVSGGINALSLADRVAVLVEERDCNRRTALVMALSPAAHEASKMLAADLEHQLLDCMAHAYDGMRDVAAEAVIAREADLKAARQHIAGLEAAATVGAGEIAGLETENVRLQKALKTSEARMEASRGTIAGLKAEVAALECGRMDRDGVMAVLREAIADGYATGGSIVALSAAHALSGAEPAQVDTDSDPIMVAAE